MEFDTHDDDDDDMGLPPPVSGAYGYASPSRSRKIPESPAIRKPTTTPSRYRECLKNHAVNIGGHAIDGCGEFMPGGEDGTLDALKCAACNCHRNFHRKETDGEAVPPPPPPPQFSPFYRSAPTPAGYLHLGPRVGPTLALPSNSREDQEEDVVNPGGFVKKRFRTKFSQEQKEKMLGFAEKIGWKIQKHDEAAVQEFCMENCVKRHVLKVWMHNNKNTLGNSKTWAQSSCKEDKVMEEGFQEHSKDGNHQIFGSDEI